MGSLSERIKAKVEEQGEAIEVIKKALEKQLEVNKGLRETFHKELSSVLEPINNAIDNHNKTLDILVDRVGLLENPAPWVEEVKRPWWKRLLGIK